MIEIKFRNGSRMKRFLKGKALDDRINLVTEHIYSHPDAYRKVMAFIDRQHPCDEYQAAYYMDTLIRVVVLSDDRNDRFIIRNSTSKYYVHMYRVARNIRIMLNEEEQL